MNKQEIAEKLKKLWGLSSDSALGDFLGVGRQGVWQWVNGKRQNDITTEIMTRLIKQIEEKN